MAPRTALVIGHTGQDGTLLCNRLLGAGYTVHGVSRSAVTLPGIASIDLNSPQLVRTLFQATRPEEVYYLAAFHHSAEDPGLTANQELLRKSLDAHVLGLQNALSAMQEFAPHAKLFYAASAHVFGPGSGPSFDEQSPLAPGCIYGITKTAGMHLCRYYRTAHGLFASVGILFNHESPLRRAQFLSQKIVTAAIDIKLGIPRRLVLGDVDATVDWGYAPDFVTAMHLILALPESDDFVIATGEPHTVADFAAAAFSALALDWREWTDVQPGIIVKRQPPRIGNASKLRRMTGWAPTVSFSEMVTLLVQDALRRRTSDAR